MSNTPTCTCLSISRDPLCVYHGDVLRLAHALNNCEVHKDIEGIRERTACAVCFTELSEELAGEKRAGDLHRDLNRRIAEALGKPQFGKNSSWHDLPEQVAQLREQRDAAVSISNQAVADRIAIEKELAEADRRIAYYEKQDPNISEGYISGL